MELELESDETNFDNSKSNSNSVKQPNRKSREEKQLESKVVTEEEESKQHSHSHSDEEEEEDDLYDFGQKPFSPRPIPIQNNSDSDSSSVASSNTHSSYADIDFSLLQLDELDDMLLDMPSKKIPEKFICEISNEMIVEPVRLKENVGEDGINHRYVDLAALKELGRWPSGEDVNWDIEIEINLTLKQEIAEWKFRNALL